MQLRTVLHRRFSDEAGTEFVYLANSAAILALDENVRANVFANHPRAVVVPLPALVDRLSVAVGVGASSIELDDRWWLATMRTPSMTMTRPSPSPGARNDSSSMSARAGDAGRSVDRGGSRDMV